MTGLDARNRTVRIVSGSAATMTGVLAWWSLSDWPRFQEVVGLGFIGEGSWIYYLASVFIAVFYISHTFNAVPFVRQLQGEFSVLKVLGVWLAIASGVLEEILFRALLMDWLEAQQINIWIQVLVSAAAFSLAHLAWLSFMPERSMLLPALRSTLALGLCLAALYVLAGRQLLPCVVAHILINIVIEPWLILSAVRGELAEHRI